MKGLLIKDIRLLMRQQRRFFMLLIVVVIMLNFLTESAEFALGYLSFLSVFFVLSTFSYDEYENGMPFLMCLPVARKDYVREKYVLGILAVGAGWLIGILCAVIFQTVQNGISAAAIGQLMRMAFFIIPVPLLWEAVTLPLVIRYGNEKGKIIAVIVVAIVCANGYLAVKVLQNRGIEPGKFVDSLFAEGLGVFAALALVLSAVVLAVSCVISQRIMRKKEF